MEIPGIYKGNTESKKNSRKFHLQFLGVLPQDLFTWEERKKFAKYLKIKENNYEIIK